MAITGKPSLAYIGVEAPTPPNMTVHGRDPNVRDLAGYRLGDFWLNRGTQNAPLQRLWVLTSKANNIAQWALIISGGGGPILTITPDGGAPVNPVLGNITINNTDGNILLTNGGPGLILENFANSIVIQNNITTVDGFVDIGSRNPAVSPFLTFSASNAGGIINAGDGIGSIFFNGFNGVGYVTGAAITAINDVGGLVPNMPAHLEFWTKPNGAGILAVRMVIASTGEVTINRPDSGTALTVNGDILTTDPGNITTTNGFVNIGSRNPVVSPILGFSASNAGGIINAGAIIGSIFFDGFNGAIYKSGAAITSTEDFGGVIANMPANLVLWTQPDSGAALAQRVVVASTGEVTINAPDSGNALLVNGTIVANPGAISTINGNLIAGAVSDTPPNLFSTVATLLTHTAGAPVAVGDNLGSFAFLATTAVGTINHAAAIGSQVEAGTVGVNRIPANIVFSTHPDAVRVPPAELLARMVIASTGAVSIAGVDAARPPNTVTLQVAGSVGVSGDDGGINPGVTFTGGADVVTPNGVGTFTIKSKSGNPLDSTGFLKIYVNNVAYFIPLFSSTAP